MLTRVFMSGNFLAVRIPKELAIMQPAEEVEIEQVGESLVIRPVKRRTLAGLGEAIALFPADFMAEGREIHEEQDRARTAFPGD